MKKIDQMRREAIHKFRRIVLLLSLLMMHHTALVASAFDKTKAVTGTTSLATDFGAALMVLAPTVGGVMEAYQYFKGIHAEDEEFRAIEKRKKQILIGIIGVFCVGGIIAIVAGYYKTEKAPEK